MYATTFVHTFIGHRKVKIFLIPLAKMLNFMSSVDVLKEFLKSFEMEELLAS